MTKLQEIAGALTSWASGIFYVGSRTPQIWKNYKRKSVEGLAIGMFMITLMANLLYGFSIILRFPSIDKAFWETTCAYIIGSIGTVLFDITLLVQSIIYRRGSDRLEVQNEAVESEQFVFIQQQQS
jgi:uncharacterized protein with PQ loop repeat